MVLKYMISTFALDAKGWDISGGRISCNCDGGGSVLGGARVLISVYDTYKYTYKYTSKLSPTGKI